MRRLISALTMVGLGVATSSGGAVATQAIALQPRARVSVGRDTVSFDRYSLKINGKRVYIWGGEFQYWRLPSPSLWRDVHRAASIAGIGRAGTASQVVNNLVKMIYSLTFEYIAASVN